MSKSYKILFLTTITLSTMISVSAYSWLGMWIGLEMNLLAIIPLMNNQSNKLSTESSIKYFIVQAMASTIILMSVIMLMVKSSIPSMHWMQSAPSLMMNSALLTKMGMAPFHFWFPEVMEGLDWMNCLLILTWQKLAPMVLMMYNSMLSMFYSIIIITAMMISTIMGINQISLRKIMTYSSINHMGWMISTMMIMKTVWFYYFIIYSLISINMIFMFNKLKTFFLNQLFQSMNSNPLIKMFFIINFLSLSGIPPFMGFFPKWITIQTLIQNNMLTLPTIMIITTLIMIYIYTRITISSLLMNSTEFKWKPHINPNSSIIISTVNFMTIWSLILMTLVFNLF